MDTTDDSQLQLTQAMLKRSVSVPHIVAAPSAAGATEATISTATTTTSKGNPSQLADNTVPAAELPKTATTVSPAAAEASAPTEPASAAAAAASAQPQQPMMTRAAAAGLITPTPATRQPVVSGIFMSQQHSHSLRTQKSSPCLPSAAVASSITFGGVGSSGSAGPASRCNSPTAGSGGSCSSSPSGGSSPLLNCFGPHRTRRYSTSFSPLAGANAGGVGAMAGGILRLTPRVSQLRQEECADISNSREVSHERDVHTALQISQSWEDLSLDASDSLSVRSGGGGSLHGGDGGGGGAGAGGGDLSNPLHVSTMGLLGLPHCSSPSPTSSRTPIRLPPYGLSPSPTRRTFATRRSMSPIAMRQSSLGPVKRKFEMDESAQYASSPPPFKRFFQERGNSPCSSGASPSHHPYAYHPFTLGASIYNHSTQYTCPSPDSTESSSGASGTSGGGGGRSTPKLFMSKLCTNSSSSFSSVSSPSTASAPSPSMEVAIDLQPHQQHEPMQTNAAEAEADVAGRIGADDADAVMKSVEMVTADKVTVKSAAEMMCDASSGKLVADSSSSSATTAVSSASTGTATDLNAALI